ncbi:glycosyltransferase [Altererythrobacter sp. CAU 1778]
MTSRTVPKIAVLLATYNGARWLDEQLDSLFAQDGVEVQIFVNDDGSADGTLAILDRWAADRPVTVTQRKAGGAGQNFLGLLRDTGISGFDYVAFCDQDDIWLPTKLATAAAHLAQSVAGGYSSSVTAFWEDGRELLIDKAQPQRRYDHHFESAGPGCTFVFPAAMALRIQADLRAAPAERLSQVALHDWFVYCWARSNGYGWTIDDAPLMRYRQHDSNVLGAASSAAARRDRWAKIRNGWYIGQARLLAGLVGATGLPADYLKRPTIGRLVRLAVPFWKLRRKPTQGVVAALALAHDYLAMRKGLP